VSLCWKLYNFITLPGAWGSKKQFVVYAHPPPPPGGVLGHRLEGGRGLNFLTFFCPSSSLVGISDRENPQGFYQIQIITISNDVKFSLCIPDTAENHQQQTFTILVLTLAFP